MGDQREGVEKDVSDPHDGTQFPFHAPPHPRGRLHPRQELPQDPPDCGEDLQDQGITRGVALDDAKVPFCMSREALATIRRIHQFLEEVGIAAMHQDLSQTASQQPGGAPRDPPVPKLLQDLDHLLTEQKGNGLPIIRRGVIETDLPALRG